MQNGLRTIFPVPHALMPKRILISFLVTPIILYRTLALSVIDYGFGLMTWADTHLKRLDTIQIGDENLAYLRVCSDETNTLHDIIECAISAEERR